VTADGSPGPNGKGGFPAERPLSSLYLAGLPVAHRTLIFRSLKQLDNVISVSLADRSTARPLGIRRRARRHARQRQRQKDVGRSLSARRSALYRPRSVPVLWDKKQRTIVNNESSEIIRMLNSAFEAFTNVRTDYYPAALRAKSTASTTSSTRPSTTCLSRRLRHQPDAYEEAARESLRRSISLKSGYRTSAISPASRLPKRTGAVHHALRFDAVYYSISNAICGASPTIPTVELSARSLSVPASPRP